MMKVTIETDLVKVMHTIKDQDAEAADLFDLFYLVLKNHYHEDEIKMNIIRLYNDIFTEQNN